MTFKTLPPGLARELLHGHEDVLTPSIQSRQALIERTPCGRCGAATAAYVPPTKEFTSTDIVPRIMARCVECGWTWDPQSDLVVDTGDPRKVQKTLHIFGKDA